MVILWLLFGVLQSLLGRPHLLLSPSFQCFCQSYLTPQALSSFNPPELLERLLEALQRRPAVVTFCSRGSPFPLIPVQSPRVLLRFPPSNTQPHSVPATLSRQVPFLHETLPQQLGKRMGLYWEHIHMVPVPLITPDPVMMMMIMVFKSLSVNRHWIHTHPISAIPLEPWLILVGSFMIITFYRCDTGGTEKLGNLP